MTEIERYWHDKGVALGIIKIPVPKPAPPSQHAKPRLDLSKLSPEEKVAVADMIATFVDEHHWRWISYFENGALEVMFADRRRLTVGTVLGPIVSELIEDRQASDFCPYSFRELGSYWPKHGAATLARMTRELRESAATNTREVTK